jgi:hypothetical protein
MVADGSSYKFSETKSRKVNNKATGSAGRIYTANPAAAEGPQFDYPKAFCASIYTTICPHRIVSTTCFALHRF